MYEEYTADEFLLDEDPVEGEVEDTEKEEEEEEEATPEVPSDEEGL
jgi:hypothetical protein